MPADLCPVDELLLRPLIHGRACDATAVVVASDLLESRIDDDHYQSWPYTRKKSYLSLFALDDRLGDAGMLFATHRVLHPSHRVLLYDGGSWWW